MGWEIQFIILVIALFSLLLTGLPVAISLGVLGFLGLWYFADFGIAISMASLTFETLPRSFVLTALPTFVLMSQLVMTSGIGADVFRGLARLFSGFPAGLALATLATATGFAAVTGVSVASCATIGPPALKEMIGRGYDKGLAIGCVSAGGGLAIIVPPSVAFIIYGYVTETSIARLFMAGVIPGLLIALGYFVSVMMWVKIAKRAAPTTPAEPLKARAYGGLSALPLFVLAIIVLGAIYTGITTPTEAACVGVVGALIMTMAYRKFHLKDVHVSLLETATTTGYIMFIIVGAGVFGNLLSFLRLPQDIAAAVVALPLAPIGILLMINILLLILGCIMDTSSLLLIVVPIVHPILVQLGFDPVQIGLILCVNIEMGMITPPVGIIIFVMQGLAEPYGATYGDVVKGSIPFLISSGAVIALVIAFPQLALWLPYRMS